MYTFRITVIQEGEPSILTVAAADPHKAFWIAFRLLIEVWGIPPSKAEKSIQAISFQDVEVSK